MKFFFISLVVLMAACASLEIAEENNTDNTKAYYEISVNEQFQVDLVSNPATGYAWKWTNKQAVTIVDTVDYSFVADSPSKIGGRGKEIWKYVGLKSGLDSIKLEYCRPWDSNSTIDSKKIVVRVH